MKQVIYTVCLMNGLLQSAYAMEPVKNDTDVAKPRGLLSCCVSGQRPAKSHAVDPVVALDRQDGRCPGCTFDEALDEKNVTHKPIPVRRQHASNNVRKAVATQALFHGVANNNLTCMLRHLGEGADVNAQDPIGWTPMEYAIRDRNTEVAAVLLAVEGIDVARVTDRGDTLDQLIAKQKEQATVGQQQSCDELQLYLDAKRAGIFPYRVQEHRLINTVDKHMLLSAVSMEGSRLQGRASVELAVLLTTLMQEKKQRDVTQGASDGLDHE